MRVSGPVCGVAHVLALNLSALQSLVTPMEAACAPVCPRTQTYSENTGGKGRRSQGARDKQTDLNWIEAIFLVVGRCVLHGRVRHHENVGLVQLVDLAE